MPIIPVKNAFRVGDETDPIFEQFARDYDKVAEILQPGQEPGEGTIQIAGDEIHRKNPPTFGAYYKWWKRHQVEAHQRVVNQIRARIYRDELIPEFFGGPERIYSLTST